MPCGLVTKKGGALPIGKILPLSLETRAACFCFQAVWETVGIKAVKTDIRVDDLLQLGADSRTLLDTVMDDISQQVAFGMGRMSGKATDHALFDAPN